MGACQRLLEDELSEDVMEILMVSTCKERGRWTEKKEQTGAGAMGGPEPVQVCECWGSKCTDVPVLNVSRGSVGTFVPK